MKTIYLEATTIQELIADIAQVIPEYNGEVEFSNGTIHGHLIGDIATAHNQEGEPTAWVGAQHANLLIPEEFNLSIFNTLTQTPANPVHKFA